MSAWDNAYTLFKSKLDPKELEKLAAMMDKATFSDLLRGVTEAREIAERKRFKYSGTIQKILKTVNEYAIVGDIMVQSNPEVTSLAWGAFRFILQVFAPCQPVLLIANS